MNSHTSLLFSTQMTQTDFILHIRDIKTKKRWITLIDPPSKSLGYWLINQGIEHHKIRIVYSNNRLQWLKALSTSVCNGLSSLVITWPDPALCTETVKALTQACDHGRSQCLLLDGHFKRTQSIKQAQDSGHQIAAITPEQLQLAL